MKYIKGKLNINKKEQKAALSSIKAIRELFGPKGENWIKGEESNERYDENLINKGVI